MPATATHDVELIQSDHGGTGGGSSGGNGYGGEGNESSGAARVPQRTYVTGMTIGLGGILMFFMALVSAYIVRKGMPNSGWVPLPVFPRILWLNTLILVASSFTIARSRRLFRADDQPGFRHWWGVTTILGIFFLVGQVIAWRQMVHAGVFLATNPSSSFFYVFTAAHGLHLLGGVLALLSVLVRPTHRLTRGTATEVVAMYWHFMDGLWVFLFLLLILGR
ncbi:MAG TPA: heme-copper oxidase subunit III [Candidatus Acidoferrales bacterium]|nr:heme-copper oxidase subunit III [Candidatus Acidoferrales bacterium]